MKFTKKQLELMAAGEPMEVVLAAATLDDNTKVEGKDGGGEDDSDDADATAINAEVAAQLVEALATVDTLKAEATTAAAALATAKADADTAKAEKVKAEETATALYAAVHARTSHLAVALGQSAPAKDISAADLAALNTKLDADFKANYVPGRQSSSTGKTAKNDDTKLSADQARMLAKAKTLPGSM